MLSLVNQSVKISGINNIILTKLDVLDDLKEIKICTGYLMLKIKNMIISLLMNRFNRKLPQYIKIWKDGTLQLLV